MQECKCVCVSSLKLHTHILGPPYASLRVHSDSSDPQIQTSQPEHSGIELLVCVQNGRILLTVQCTLYTAIYFKEYVNQKVIIIIEQ